MILKLIKGFGVLVLLAATVSTADALNAAARCDKAKSTAAGTLFKAIMLCNTKWFAGILDNAGLAACSQKAEDKCVAAFDRADAAFGPACTVAGNGSSLCDETRTSAENIYSGI